MLPNNPMAGNQIPEVQTALQEIRVFAAQMQEITALFTRGHADMARQLEAVTIRLDRAVETVAMGEARISAQIASFDRMTNEMRRTAEEHDRSLRGMIDNFQRHSTQFTAEALRPLKTEVDGAVRMIADASAEVAKAGTGISSTLETAVGIVQASTQKSIGAEMEKLSGFVAGTMQATEAKFTSASEVFDKAAGALAHRIWSAVEAQDAKLGSLESLAEKLGVIKDAATAQEHLAAKLARTEAAACTMDEASKAVALASSKIVSAVVELKTSKSAPDVSHKPDPRLDTVIDGQARLLEGVTALSGLMDRAIIKASAERGEAVTEMLQRLDGLHEMAVAARAVPAEASADSLPLLSDEKESLQRVLTGFKLLQRDISSETERLRGSIDLVANRADAPTHDGRIEQAINGIADAILAVNRKIDGLATSSATEAVAQPMAATLPTFGPERESVQRLLVSFRLLLRDIGEQSGKLKTAVEGVAGQALTVVAPTPREERAPLVQARLDQNFAALAAAIERLDAKVEGLKSDPVVEAATAVEAKETKPVTDLEKNSLQRLLVGFRLLLREISAETEAYREKVAGIRQPEMLVLSPTIEPEVLAPLHSAADRIAEGVAETLATLEQKLADPVLRLNDAATFNAEALKLAHQAMAAPTPSASAATMPTEPDKLADAVQRMEQAALLIDGKIGHVDQLLATLRKGGAASTDALRDLVAGLEAAAGSLRLEAGDFLAVGAALSRELETSLPMADIPATARQARRTPAAKKKAA